MAKKLHKKSVHKKKFSSKRCFLFSLFAFGIIAVSLVGVRQLYADSIKPVEHVTITNSSIDKDYNLSVTFDDPNAKGSVQRYYVTIYDSYSNQDVACATTESNEDPVFFTDSHGKTGTPFEWKTGRYRAEVVAACQGVTSPSAYSPDFFVTTFKEHDSAKFTDIANLPKDRIEDIEWAYQYGIVKGSNNDTIFMPNSPVNRGAMAEFLNNYCNKVQTTQKSEFNDLAGLSKQRIAAINWVSAEGITSGYGSPYKYGPQYTVSRAQMATFLYRLFGCPAVPDSAPIPADFTDDTSVHYDSIRWLCSTGITNLNSDGMFFPNNPVTRGAMVQFLKRAFKLEMNSDDPYVFNPQFAIADSKDASAGNTILFKTRYIPENVTRDNLHLALHAQTGGKDYSATILDYEYINFTHQEISFVFPDNVPAGLVEPILAVDSTPVSGDFILKAMNTKFSGTFTGGCISTTPHIDINFDPIKYIRSDNTKYSAEIAENLSLFAHTVYADAGESAAATGSNVILDGASYGVNSPTGLASGLGLEQPYFYDLSTKTLYNFTGKDITIPGYSVDYEDTTAWLFAHKRLHIDGQDYEFVLVSIRGTNGTVAEWGSNFDVGANTFEYSKRTGPHPDWRDKSNHKGFDVAANRAMVALDSYMDKVLDPNAKKVIFNTGHSRGAAISNLIGKVLEDRQRDGDIAKAYTYTFATPASTAASKSVADSYKTVFNVCNEDDLVPLLPPEACGFRLYGKKMTASVNSDGAQRKGDKYGQRLVNLLNSFVGDGFSYSDNSYVKDVENAFSDVVKDRADYYVTTDSDTEKFSFYCKSEASADAEIDYLKELGLLKYCDYEKEDGLIFTYVNIKPSPAYMSRVLALLANDSTWAAQILSGIGAAQLWGSYFQVAKEFIYAGVAGIENIHMTTSYYILAKYAFQTQN